MAERGLCSCREADDYIARGLVFVDGLLQPRAPINIQCRFVAGEVIPFEINPRFSGTTSLRALAGYNEPDVLVRRDVLGEQIETYFRYRDVLILRGLKENVISI